MTTIQKRSDNSKTNAAKETPAKAKIHLARDAAIIRTMSNGLLRISEVGTIRCDHIRTHENGSGSLLIPRGKTDQEGEGKHIYLQKRGNSTDSLEARSQ